MKTSSELHHLIHYLTPSEKRYFKLYASAFVGTDNIHLQLFDAINKQSEYDENILIKKFSNEIKPQQFSYAKNYLFQVVLKSLENFHHNQSIEMSLNSSLSQIEILFQKGLYDACGKLIAKSLASAQEHEKYAYALQISEWEKRLAYVDSSERKDYDTEQNLVNKIQREISYSLFRREVSMTNKNYGISKTKEIAKVFEELKDSHHITEPIDGDSLLSKYRYQLAQITLCYQLEDKEGAYTNALVVLNKMESYWKPLPNDLLFMVNYVQSIYSVIFGLLIFKKYDEVKLYVKKYQDLLENPYVKSNIYLTSTIKGRFYFTVFVDFIIACNNKDIEQHIKQFEKDYLEIEKVLPSRLVNYVIIPLGFVYFILKQYKDALRWNQYLLQNISFLGMTEKIDQRLFEIILYYELNHQSIIDLKADSTRKFMTKTENVSPEEKFFLTQLNKIMHSPVREQVDLFKELKAKLISLKKEEALGWDFITWIDSKIQNKSVMEIIGQRIFQKRG